MPARLSPLTTARRGGSALASALVARAAPPRRPLGTTAARLANGYPAQGRPQASSADPPGSAPPPIPKPSQRAPAIPAYPFGERRVYKQSNGGLYGSARIRFGNTVSERNEIKTRRKWRPNVQRKRLWSAALGCFVQTRVTTRVMRTVDKAGGLDEYLLGSKAARLRELGPWGWKLRWRVMQTDAARGRFAREREALGLPPLGPAGQRAAAAAELAGLGLTEDGLMRETQEMLDQGAEFALGGGDAADAAAADEIPDEFMREEPRPRA